MHIEFDVARHHGESDCADDVAGGRGGDFEVGFGAAEAPLGGMAGL